MDDVVRPLGVVRKDRVDELLGDLVGDAHVGALEVAHIDLAEELVELLLDLARARFARVGLDHVLEDVALHPDVAGGVAQLVEDLRHDVVRTDHVLVVGAQRLDRDLLDAVEEDRVDPRRVVVAEDEDALGEVKEDAREVAVGELAVLRGVGEVREDADDLLAPLGRRNLVELVDVDDRVHTLGVDDAVDDAPPGRADVRVVVPLERGAVGRAAQRDEDEGARLAVLVFETFGDAVLRQRGLAGARRTLEAKDAALVLAVDPLRHQAGDLPFGGLHPVDAVVQGGLDIPKIVLLGLEVLVPVRLQLAQQAEQPAGHAKVLVDQILDRLELVERDRAGQEEDALDEQRLGAGGRLVEHSADRAQLDQPHLGNLLDGEVERLLASGAEPTLHIPTVLREPAHLDDGLVDPFEQLAHVERAAALVQRRPDLHVEGVRRGDVLLDGLADPLLLVRPKRDR